MCKHYLVLFSSRKAVHQFVHFAQLKIVAEKTCCSFTTISVLTMPPAASETRLAGTDTIYTSIIMSTTQDAA